MATGIVDVQRKIPELEYVSNVYWGSDTWTCPDNGIATADMTTKNGYPSAYWYIQDTTLGAPVGKISQPANGTSSTVSFPVTKGHVYATSAQSAIETAYVYYYKYV